MSILYDTSFDLAELTDSSFGFQTFDNLYTPPPKVTFESPNKVDQDDEIDKAQVEEKKSLQTTVGKAKLLAPEEYEISTPPWAIKVTHRKILASPGSKVSF